MKTSPINSRHFAKYAAIGMRVTLRGILLRLSLFVPVILLNAPAPAQETSALHAPQGVSTHEHRSLDKRVQLLARYLNLSDAQQSTLKKILLETQREMLKLRLASSSGDGLQIDLFRAIEDNTAERIRGMLTEEQRKKYDPLRMRKSISAAPNVGVEDWLKGTGTR